MRGPRAGCAAYNERVRASVVMTTDHLTLPIYLCQCVELAVLTKGVHSGREQGHKLRVEEVADSHGAARLRAHARRGMACRRPRGQRIRDSYGACHRADCAALRQAPAPPARCAPRATRRRALGASPKHVIAGTNTGRQEVDTSASVQGGVKLRATQVAQILRLCEPLRPALLRAVEPE